MTTALAKRTELHVADWADMLAVMRETYKLWNAGMSRADYDRWTTTQLEHPWARKNFRYYVLREGAQIVASCKIYTLPFLARGVEYKIAGIGAVFTMPRHRGQGHATKLLEGIIEMAEQHDFDGLLLYNDIDCGFYEQLGFELMSDHEFYLWLTAPSVERQIMSDQTFAEDLHEHSPELLLVEPDLVPEMVSHYQRCLPAQAFNLRRTESYWQFKLNREMYVQQHSRQQRPALEMLAVDMSSSSGGYALFEHTGKILRVLEVVGKPEAQESLWRNLLRTALLRRVHLVRGWESCAPKIIRGTKFVERDAAKPMLLPLNPACESWVDATPCPLFELDHF
jgi:predicted acetyltransferase